MRALREGDRERERHRERERDRETQRDRETERQRDREHLGGHKGKFSACIVRTAIAPRVLKDWAS